MLLNTHCLIYCSYTISCSTWNPGSYTT